MRSSYPQTDEPNYFPELWILKLAYKIKYVLKFDSSEACTALKITKIQNFNFMKKHWLPIIFWRLYQERY